MLISSVWLCPSKLPWSWVWISIEASPSLETGVSEEVASFSGDCSVVLSNRLLVSSLGFDSVWLLFSILLESLLNNPVNQFHILAKNPSTCSLDGRFIVDLSVASIWASFPSKLSLVLSSILELLPLNNPSNQSPIPAKN